ncbi:MAG: glycosyltransferase family 4 protein [Candidatus Rokubacteria bacterium]|nr:glycosyltransferase family 4 protein [Candidatus Rokubacteria bacterium]
MELARRGHRIHVVTYPMHHPIPVPGVTIHRVGNFLRSRPVTIGLTLYKPLLDALMLAPLIGVIHRERLEVIHAHNYEAAVVGYAAKLLTGRPLVYNAVTTMQDELPGYLRPRSVAAGLARLLDAWVPRGADEVIVLSEELRAFLTARGVRADRITHVPAGVYPEMFAAADPTELRRRLGLGDAPLVMYTGSLAPFQRVDYLVRAMARVTAEIPAARLVLGVNVATEDELAHVRDLTRQAGVEDRLVIEQAMTLEELPTLIAAADVTVVPRPSCPGFPVKLLNYMAARKPIVAFRGSAKGLGHLEQAFLAEDHDWEGLAAGITTLLKDRSLAARLGAQAHAAIIGTFDWPSLAAKTESVYAKLLISNERGRRQTEERAL